MTAVRGQAPPAGGTGPLPGLRREYLLGLALGAAGAGAVLLSARQGWARVLTPAPPPLPADSVTVTGQDLVPLAAALGVAALATLAAVIATRSLARRLTAAPRWLAHRGDIDRLLSSHARASYLSVPGRHGRRTAQAPFRGESGPASA